MSCDLNATKAFVALGANDLAESGLLKNRLAQAIADLDGDDIAVGAVSEFYKTPCFPEGYGNDFVNAAIEIETSLSPSALMTRLHALEHAYGRQRKLRWGTRSLDLDLIAFGDLVLPNLATFQHWESLPLDRQMSDTPAELILPHPRLQQRAFVIVPLMDIAPDWRHPVSGATIADMYMALPAAEVDAVTRLKH